MADTSSGALQPSIIPGQRHDRIRHDL